MLVNSHFDLTQETEEGMTALQLAAALNRIEIANVILNFVTESQFKKSFIQEIISKINT